VKKIIVLYDAEKADTFESDIKPLLGDAACKFLAFEGQSLDALSEGQKVLLWLGDAALQSLLLIAVRQAWQIGVIPHPDMNRALKLFRGLGTAEEAIAKILSDPDPVTMDLMVCNQQCVLGSVMIGNPEVMMPAALMDENWWCKIKNFFVLLLSFRQTSLVSYQMTTEKEAQVNTAALSMALVYRPGNSEFTKRTIGETEKDEATLNAVIFSPRSIVESLHFLWTKFLPKQVKTQERLPSYLGHIKTASLTVKSSSGLLNISIDGEPFQAEALNAKIEADALQTIGLVLPEKQPLSEQKEAVRVSNLPKGQVVKELVNRPLSWIHHSDPEEVKETFIAIHENAQSSESYKVLMVLSALLATVGLFANATPVIIGAMILAPLMSPIISLSMGVLRQNIELISTSGKTLLVGIGLAMVFGTVLTWLIPLTMITPEIQARLSPNLLDLGVAIFSGVAAAYASARSEVAKSLAGVAIAVALVPPLGVAAIGIGWWDWPIFSGAFLLFLTNLVGIILAAAATFLMMGFSPFHLAKRGLLIASVSVVLVSIPLVLAFNGLVEKQRITTVLQQLVFENIQVKDIRVISNEDYIIAVKLMANRILQTDDIVAVKSKMEKELGHAILLEAQLVVVQ